MNNNWTFNQEYNYEEYFGFIYLITNLISNKKYIGKKNFYSINNNPIRKKVLNQIKGRGRKPTKEKIIKESDWRTYYGSNTELKEDIKVYGKENFKREILILCKSKTQLTYWETKLQFSLGVLEYPENWYNNSILGKFYSKDINNGEQFNLIKTT
jgi:hypothetical protein